MRYRASDRSFLAALGSQIRLLRRAKGWSQEELAFQSGLHRTYVGAIERGERNVSALNLRKIASALDVSLTKLFAFHRDTKPLSNR